MQSDRVIGKRVIVAVTGASGAIYARLTLQRLIECESVAHIALVCSDTAKQTVAFECEQLPLHEKIEQFDNHNLFADAASGSARYDAMIVVPCSAGTLARIANGISQTLIERAADVMLKERRPIVAVLREAPYSLIHLRNMEALTAAGGVIVPASPSFYSRPSTIEEVCMTVVERALAQAGIDTPHFEWRGRNDSL